MTLIASIITFSKKKKKKVPSTLDSRQKDRLVFVRHRSGLIWFVVADYKCFGLIFSWIMFATVYQIWVPLIKSMIGDRDQKYDWRSSSGD